MTTLDLTTKELRKGITVGFTKARVYPKKGVLTITHGGNMGNGIDSVNKNLKRIGLPTIEFFRENFEVVENGSPDYFYSIDIAL